MAETVLALQRALVESALMPDPEAFTDDPALFAARQGLPPRDQTAFLRFGNRLPVYRELIRNSLADPIEAMFPILQSLLEDDWEPCLDAFLDARRVPGPHYRDVAPAFLGWLADTGWGLDRWPFLLELAHFELLESLVERCPESPAPLDLHEPPSTRDRLLLDPATRVVAYSYAVQEATVEQPEPRAAATHLMGFRDGDGDVRWVALTPGTAALLVRAQTEAVRDAVAALGLPSLPEAMGLLLDFRTQGAVLGFRAPT